MIRLILLLVPLITCPALAKKNQPPPPPEPATPLPVGKRDLAPLGLARIIASPQRLAGIQLDPDVVTSFAHRELQLAGYPVANPDLFGQGASSQARFLLGGTTQSLECTTPGGPTTCVATVSWELFDRTQQLVVYQATTRGAYQDANPTVSPTHALQGIINGLKSLLSREAFVSQLESPHPTTLTVGKTDPPIPLPATKPPKKPFPYATALTIGGSVVGAVGSLVILSASVTNSQSEAGQQRREEALIAGVVLASVGAVAVISGQIMVATKRAKVAAGIAPNGLIVQGRF